MGNPPSTDGITADGNQAGGSAAQPEIAVLDQSTATNTGPAAGRTEPGDHDLYRRPAQRIPFRRPPATPPAVPLDASTAPTGRPGAEPADPGATGEMPVVTDDEVYPPFALIDELFLEDGPDLPTQVTAAQPVAADARYEDVPPYQYEEAPDVDPESLSDASPTVVGGAIHPPGLEPVPAGGRSGRRILGLRVGGLVAAVLIALLAVTGVLVAVLDTKADPRPTAGGGPGTGVTGGAAAAEANAADTGAGALGEGSGGTVGANPPEAGENAGTEPADPAAAHSASAARDGREHATFDLVNGTTTVNLHAEDLGEDLYRIKTRVGGDVVPKAVAEGDKVRLQLVPSGDDGPGAVDITLNSEVQWTLRMTGGAAEHVIDMSDGRLAGLDLAGGATRIELTLPRADGTVKVRMTGGVNQFAVNTAPGTPVKLRIGSGAARVVLDGRAHKGIAPGRVFTSSRFKHADDRVEVDAVAGVGTLTLAHY